ncbi:single-stranded-DNA-specific exonuclease RecJ [Candidatus Saccharibacteria bacterium]|nr:single-stranded-DNA-specific exonuclease RecJ [Candidatus Saccharibacteria bacterium]
MKLQLGVLSPGSSPPGTTPRSKTLSPLFIKLLKSRGIDESFLNPRYEDLGAAGDLPDMAKAVKRIRRAIKAGEKILVFGDYDADGVTATAVLVRGLGHLGAEVRWDLPERVRDGYGLPERILETLAADVKLLITVDCGSRDFAVVRRLKERGVDVIITDHHEVSEDGALPEAVAVINPKRRDSKYGFSELAGVGVAFQLVRALASSPQTGASDTPSPDPVATGRARLVLPLPRSESSSAPDLRGTRQQYKSPEWTKWLLDLVALGTVCDQAPLLGDNRILVWYGLKVMAKSKWRGLRELTRDLKRIDAYALGFVVGPKINASGRLESPRKALELLLTDDAMEASELAMQLEDLNDERKAQQRKALESLKLTLGVKNDLTVVVARGKWHEGLIGLIAGKLVEQHEKPVFVFTETGEGLKCSARSFGEFSCAKAISHLRELGLVEKGGGHAAAGGMSISADNFEAVRAALDKYYRSLGLTNQERFLRERADIEVENVEELTVDFWREVQELAPFGQGNREPILRVRGRLYERRTMGKAKEHVSLKIGDAEGRPFELCAWHGAEKWGDLAVDRYEFDFRAVYSEFGAPHVEGRVVDVVIDRA